MSPILNVMIRLACGVASTSESVFVAKDPA